MPQIQKGDIYILSNCPPLHGEQRKDRPVVAIAPIPGYGTWLIVAISSTARRSVRDRVALPDKATDPATTTGLDQPSWAVPAWFMHATPLRVGTQRIGFLPETLRMQVTNAVIARIEARFPRVELD